MIGNSEICRRTRERFSELREGDVPDDARREMEAHLAGCPACGAAHAAFKAMIQGLRELPRAEPPADLPERIDRSIDRLGDRIGRASAGRSGFRLARHAVAALLVAGIVVGIIRVVPEATDPFQKGKQEPAREAFRSDPAEEEGARRQEPLSNAVDMNKEAAETPVEPPLPHAASEEQRSRKALPGGAPPVAAKRSGEPVGALTATPAGEAAAPAGDAGAGRGLRAAVKPEAAPSADRLADAAAPAGYAAKEAVSPRALLLSARGDRAWVAAIRDLALRRPAVLAATWETLGEEERERVLDAWRRATPPDDLARDLARALEGADGDSERKMIETLRRAAPRSRD